MTSPLLAYQQRVQTGLLKPDSAQAAAARELDRLCRDLKKPRWLPGRRNFVRGVYLYGGVGRGKSMLMDLFFDTVKDTVRSRRIHFHEFMLETHDWLHKARQSGTEDDLLPRYAAQVSKNLKLICFDEFHVTDVADAMILSRLFTALFERGVTMVATSNWPPEKLYEGGLQRARFLPFIDLVQERLVIVALDGGIDYREAGLLDAGNYFTPADARAAQLMDRLFDKYTNGAPVRRETLTVKGRALAIEAAGGVARASFAQLCEQPLGAEDYLTLASHYHTLFIDHIPRLGYDRRNEVKRLMTLIDVLYDHRIKIFISADASPDKLNYGGAHAMEFERTVSRLTEMQSKGYGASHV